MKSVSIFMAIGLVATSISFADVDLQKNQIKQQIIKLAKSYEGQGDPDFSKQNSLEPLVQQLLTIAPQPEIKDRLNLLAGSWKQVWGPYDYKNNNRGVDPELGTEEIYQVVSSEGYYYNASYLYKDGDRNQKRIGLLRGEYTLDNQNLNSIKVQFTDFPGASQKSEDLELWQLPELAENDTLDYRITIVPSFIVRRFFNGGSLREVYTDSDLRITYGSTQKDPGQESIYIMTRVQ